MADHQDIEDRARRDVEEARERIASVEEGHKRWNRMEEAMDVVCEEAVSVLDQLGRSDQADEIQSHMAAHERFDLILQVLRDEGDALAAEAAAAGLADDYRYCQLVFPAMDELANEVRHHRPGA